MITKEDIRRIIGMGNSHIIQIPGLPMGVTKFQSFLAIRYIIHGKLYWYALREAYEMSDNLYDYRYDLKLAFQSNEPERQALMSKKERDYLESLPDQITIYRGMTVQEYESNNFGISWTLEKEKADYFAFTYIRNIATNHLKRIVHELTINKNDVIAFFNGRGEFEIIYLNPFKQLWQQ